MFQMKENLHYVNEREEKRERKDTERIQSEKKVASWSLDVDQSVNVIKTYDIFSIHDRSREISYMQSLILIKHHQCTICI